MKRAILSLSLSLYAATSWAQLGLCTLRPLEPPCCPIPCPIGDSSRLPQLIQAVQSLQTLLTSGSQWDSATAALNSTIGTAPSQNLFTALQPELALTSSAPPGVTGSPVTEMQTLKSSLFVNPDQPPTASLAASLGANRATAAVNEARNGLALSASRISNPASPPSAGVMLPAAIGDGLRGDVQIGSRVRLQLLSDLMLSAQLIAGEAARAQTKQALSHPMPLRSAGDQIAPPPAAPKAQSLPASAPASAGSPDASLRAAAAGLLASYPALQTVLDQAALSAGFAQSASAELAKQLNKIGIADQLLPDLQEAWRQRDNDRSSVVALISRYGAVPAAAEGDLGMAIQDWRQADRQSRDWQALAVMAAGQIAALDRGLGQISDLVGYDITAPLLRQSPAQR